MARELTASGLDLAELCPGPFVLDGVETTDAASEEGTEVHAQIAAWVNFQPADAQPPDPRHPKAMAALRWAWESEIVGMKQSVRFARAEVAYALDPQTGEVRELGTGGGRDYSAAPAGWICGTVDLVAVAEGEVTVIDWKTGAGAAFIHGDPARALQLLFGAYCVARLAAVDSARARMRNAVAAGCSPYRVEVVDHHMPRARALYAFVGEDGVTPREAVIESEEWPAVLGRLRAVAGKVAAARAGALQVRTGEHCGRCGSVLACPATVQAVQLLAPPPVQYVVQGPSVEDAEDVARIIRTLGMGREPVLVPSLPAVEVAPPNPGAAVAAATPAQVAQAFSAWRHLEKIGDALKKRARLLAEQGQLPGYALEIGTRREIDGGIAHAVLKALHGPEAAKAGVEVATSRERITDALRAERDRQIAAALPEGASEREVAEARKPFRGWLARAEREVMAAIAARDGITTKEHKQLVAVDEPAPALPPAEGAQER